MAGEKQPTHKVNRHNLFLMVGTALQLVPFGTPVVLSKEQAKLATPDTYLPIKEGKTLDLSGDEEKTTKPKGNDKPPAGQDRPPGDKDEA